MKRINKQHHSQGKTPESSNESFGKSHPGSMYIKKTKPPSPEKTMQKQPEKSVDNLEEQIARLLADFDNFRKRTLRDKAELYQTANQDIMLELLPVLDHCQLAIQAAIDHNTDDPFRKGLQMIFDQLIGVLSKFGLAAFDAKNEPFDPNRFEAVNYIASDTEPEGTIITQIRRGYLLKNKLLRPAQVIVSSGPRQSEQNNQVNPAEHHKGVANL